MLRECQKDNVIFRLFTVIDDERVGIVIRKCNDQALPLTVHVVYGLCGFAALRDKSCLSFGLKISLLVEMF
jgi:hypothetical protein